MLAICAAVFYWANDWESQEGYTEPPPPGIASTRWRVLTERARIRAAPSTAAEILATLPAGTLLPLAASADPRAEWLAVRFEDRHAFVARRLTRPAAPPTTEQQTTAPGQQQARQSIESLRNRPYTQLHVEPGQTTAWIWVPQGGCVNWDANGAWVWMATPDGKVVLYSPGLRPTHIAFTAPETHAVNVRYHIVHSGNCGPDVPSAPRVAPTMEASRHLAQPIDRCQTMSAALKGARGATFDLERVSLGDYQVAFEAVMNRGYRPRDITITDSTGGPCISVSWVSSDGRAWAARHGLDDQGLAAEDAKLGAQGFRIVDREQYRVGGHTWWAAIWLR
jgi:Bacterial tandem repeat domain 1